MGLIKWLTGNILGPVFDIVDKVVPDKDLAMQLKNQIQNVILSLEGKKLDIARDIIVAEANGHSWLQRNWRPLTMLTFVALIVSWWLGFTPARASEELMKELFGLIKVGLGGYVIGRSAEKTVPQIIEALKGR